MMKKYLLVSLCLIFILYGIAAAAQKDVEVHGRKLISLTPAFTLTLPSELKLVHTFSQENPAESSLTRVFFLARTRGTQVEEMLILQIADRINPQASPIVAPPLKPYTENRLYSKGKVKKDQIEIDYLTQLMAWNPEAPSLQAIIKMGFVIPGHWALQGQFQFHHQGQNAVLCRYSRDIQSLGIKVSDKVGVWEKGLISGNEKKAYESFQQSFLDMMDSIQMKKKGDH